MGNHCKTFEDQSEVTALLAGWFTYDAGNHSCGEFNTQALNQIRHHRRTACEKEQDVWNEKVTAVRLGTSEINDNIENTSRICDSESVHCEHLPHPEPIVFSLNVSLNSFNYDNKYYVSKIIRTCHLLCKRPRCFHSISKTQVSETIFKLNDL